MKNIVAFTFAALLVGAFLSSPAPAQSPGKYKNFRVAIYVTRGQVSQWGDLQRLAADYEAMTHQVKFDKVYLEFATNGQQVNEATLDPMKKFFIDHGILVSAATVTGGSYADQRNLDRMKNVAETAARHFDELILDDWFFTSSKNAADIAAKGTEELDAISPRSPGQCFREPIDQARQGDQPKFRLIIKYPNWYEHYQAWAMTWKSSRRSSTRFIPGVETRDPIYTEQHLQQYESYSLVRYLENVKPGGNDGVWVDKLMTRYIDRYAEQIWDAAFAKPKEITLWQWPDAASRINIGTRPWESLDTSLNYKKMLATYKPPAGSNSEATTGHVAGYALEQLDTFLDKLGKPIGIPAYRPPHAIGEEFLHDYLGMIGIPIDLHPAFPETGGERLHLDRGAPSTIRTSSRRSRPAWLRAATWSSPRACSARSMGKGSRTSASSKSPTRGSA